MARIHPEPAARLTDADKLALLMICRHRCLTVPQLARHVYRAGAETAAARTEQMIQNRLLETAEYGADTPALFLTQRGVRMMRALFTARDARLREDLRQVLLAGKSAAQLRIRPKNIGHQAALNSFVLAFEERIRPLGVPYGYYDGKYMPPCSPGMKPDGMIDLGHTAVLLEEDMGSESAGALSRKWGGYRDFLSAPGPRFRGRRMVALVILDRVQMLSQRRNTVWATVSRHLLDRVDGNFELYADAPDVLLDLLTGRLAHPGAPSAMEVQARSALTEIHGFSFAPVPGAQALPFSCDAYIRKCSDGNRVDIVDGRPQEFLVNFWADGGLSGLHKIRFHPRAELAMEQAAGRRIPCVTVVPDEEWICRALEVCGVRETPGVWFTTAARLRERPFHEALFQTDAAGSLVHFRTPGLRAAVFERGVRRG